MQHSAQSPQQHARWHPSHHAILASQRRAGRLESHEESEEERYGSIQIALFEPNIGREVCRLGVANLSFQSAHMRKLGRSRRYVGLVEGVEEEQQGKERQEKRIELQQRPLVQVRSRVWGLIFVVVQHGVSRCGDAGELVLLDHCRGMGLVGFGGDITRATISHDLLFVHGALWFDVEGRAAASSVGQPDGQTGCCLMLDPGR